MEFSAKMDWKEVLSLYNSNMTDDGKENLYDKIAWLDADDIDIHFTDMKALFGIAQEMLRYKGEQVRNLTSDLEDANNKCERLEAQRDNGKGSSRMRRLSEKISKQEDEIRDNNQIIEKLLSEVSELENRKENLVQDRHSTDRDSSSSRDPITDLETVRNLTESVNTKNKHIKQLLSDLQGIERENELLRDKLAELREKLSEATDDINDLTNKVSKLRNERSIFKEKLQTMIEAKSAFEIQTEELKLLSVEKDKFLDEYSKDMERRVTELKQTLKQKDLEVNILRDDVTKMELLLTSGDKEETILSEMLKQRDIQIRELQMKLTEATREIESSVALIERLHKNNETEETDIYEPPRKPLPIRTASPSDESSNSASTNDFKVRVQHLENNLETKEKELVETLRELELFKSTDEGMANLLKDKIRLKEVLKSREDSVKKLVQDVNALNSDINLLQMENEAMRSKLNLPHDQIVPTNSITNKISKLEKLKIASEQKIAEMENTNLSLQLEIRSKNKQLKSMERQLKRMTVAGIRSVANSSDSESSVAIASDQAEQPQGQNSKGFITPNGVPLKDETEIMKRNFKLLVDENEGLRKGLHEVLDAVKTVGLSACCDIRSTSLENILLAMDARHMAGWYNPHMSTEMELKAAIGGRDALQMALADARKEIKSAMDLLSQEMRKSSELEQKLLTLQEKSLEGPVSIVEGPDGQAFGGWLTDDLKLKEANFSNGQTIRETYMKPLNRQHATLLQQNLAYFQKQFASLYGKIVEISHQSATDKHGWSLREEQYKLQVANLTAKIESANSVSNDSESESSIGCVPRSQRRIDQAQYLDRKCQYLSDCFKRFRSENIRLKTELLGLEKTSKESIGTYENRLLTMILTLNSLHDRLRNSVPLSIFLKQNEQLNNTSFKYRECLEKYANFNREDSEKQKNSLSLLENEVAHLRKERDDLLIVLASERERSTLASSLAAPSLDEKLARLAKDYSVTQTENQSLKYDIRRKDSTCLILKTQVDSMSQKVDDLYKVIDKLQSKIVESQEVQNDLFNKMTSCITYEEYNLSETKVNNLSTENDRLTVELTSLTTKLNAAESEIKDLLQHKFLNDLELNMLQHQVLDLQATDDNKAVIGRLGSEVMLSHLQTTELHRKLDKLSSSLDREKSRRLHAESALTEKEKKFDVFASRLDFKNRFLSDVIQILRKEFEGGFPLVLMENYLNERSRLKDLEAKIHGLDESMTDGNAAGENIPEDVKSCSNEDDNSPCRHFMEMKLKESKHSRELDLLNKKLSAVESTRDELLQKYNHLEETYLMVSFAFDKKTEDIKLSVPGLKATTTTQQMEIVEFDSPGQNDSSTYIPVPKPRKVPLPSQVEKQVGKSDKRDVDVNLPGSPVTAKPKPSIPLKTVIIQTDPEPPKAVMGSRGQQTEPLSEPNTKKLLEDLDTKTYEMKEALTLAKDRSDRILELEVQLSSEVKQKEYSLRLGSEKDAIISSLNEELLKLKSRLETEESTRSVRNRENEIETAEIQLDALRRERDDHRTLHERAERKIQDLQEKTIDMEKECNDLRAAILNPTTLSTVNETMERHTSRVLKLESKCFRLQTEVDNHMTELLSSKTETERWKNLAIERFAKIELLGKELEERHKGEMESCQMESSHWMAELTLCQREIGSLKANLSQQKSSFLKQCLEKDNLNSKLREINDNLKMQLVKMQNMLANTAPSLDLSAVFEIDEEQEESALEPLQSNEGSFREFASHSDDNLIGSQSLREGNMIVTPGWHDSLVNRLRREKQLISKQNIVLRKQLKLLAARERRSRLEAQNLKSQMKRTSLSNKGLPYTNMEDASSTALKSKINSLQLQLAALQSETERSRTNINSMALWEKQKRWQMVAERFKARYEEKCSEFDKLKMSYEGIRTAISRLEKEKRLLEARLSKTTREKEPSSGDEKVHLDSILRENETLRSQLVSLKESVNHSPHMDRIEQQQRKIAAFELASKGDHHLISEYERVLAQNALLTRQNLKLESQILEYQILSVTEGNAGGSGSSVFASPGQCCSKAEKEIQRLNDYVSSLKDELSQLSVNRYNSSSTDHQSTLGSARGSRRHADMEKTILTLRDLVSKLQVENRHLMSARKTNQ